MKNRVWIVAVIILAMALACGIGFWKEVQTVNQKVVLIAQTTS